MSLFLVHLKQGGQCNIDLSADDVAAVETGMRSGERAVVTDARRVSVLVEEIAALVPLEGSQ